MGHEGERIKRRDVECPREKEEANPQGELRRRRRKKGGRIRTVRGQGGTANGIFLLGRVVLLKKRVWSDRMDLSGDVRATISLPSKKGVCDSAMADLQ